MAYPAGSPVHPKTVGDQTTAMVLARLVQAGRIVLLPFGENHRYDLVVDEGVTFLRVQCKTGRLRNGVIWFPTCSTTYHHPKNRGIRFYRQDYAQDADVFGVYRPELDHVYLVPVGAVGKVKGTLRVDPTRSRQSKGVRWAKDHLLEAPG